MEEKGRSLKWKEISTAFRALPWTRPAFGNHLIVLWGRVMESHPSQAEDAECLHTGNTPFGGKWPNIGGLFSDEISQLDEMKIRYVLCTLVGNAWGEVNDVVKWSKGEDQTLGAGPLMAICTSSGVSTTRSTCQQCPGCDLYIPTMLSPFTRDAHISSCCLQLCKRTGMEVEDLAVASIDTAMYQEHRCKVCEGLFFGHEIQVLGHAMLCNASNTSMVGCKHSTIIKVYLEEFNVMVSVTTTKAPREQPQITSFLTNKATTMAKAPSGAVWDERVWTKQDAIYREAYERCCIIDGEVNIGPYLETFNTVLNAADNPPVKGGVTRWALGLTKSVLIDTWAKRKENFPFTLNYLIGATSGSTKADSRLDEFTKLLHKKRKTLVKLLPHGAALKLMFNFLKATKHNSTKRKDTLVAALGQDLALACFCSRLSVQFHQAVKSKKLTKEETIKHTTPLHWALSLTTTWCKKTFAGIPTPYVHVAPEEVKNIEYATPLTDDSGTEDYSSEESNPESPNPQQPTTTPTKRARSRSRSKSPHRPRSRSRSKSPRPSSRSGSPHRPRSKSRSKSPRPKSRSKSPYQPTRSRSRSTSPRRSRSRSRTPSRSRSRSAPPPTKPKQPQTTRTRGAKKRKRKTPRRITSSSSRSTSRSRSRPRSRSRSKTRNKSPSPTTSTSRPRARRGRSTKKKETASTVITADKLEKYQKRYREGYDIRGLSPDYWKWVEEHEKADKTKAQKRGNKVSTSSSEEITKPPKKRMKKTKTKHNKHKGRTSLAHRAIPRGYVHSVVTLGAPRRQGKIINQVIAKLLGGKCRVSALAGKKLEDVLEKFITKFTTCVNTTKSLQAAVDKYISEHQQYFAL